MPNPYFQFKQFIIYHDRCAMKVTTDACLFGAWCAAEIQNSGLEIQNALDIGTGTGLLPLMIAQKNPDIKIDTVEIDPGAVKQAKENLAASPWKNAITVYEADIKKFTFQQQYNCIISNPPFYENEIKAVSNQRNLALHSEALLLEDTIHIIKKNLITQGIFFLLLPYKRNNELGRLLKKYSLTIQKKVLVKPSCKHDYFRILIKGSMKGSSESDTEELSIYDHQQQYTSGFINLLQDYYLYL